MWAKGEKHDVYDSNDYRDSDENLLPSHQNTLSRAASRHERSILSRPLLLHLTAILAYGLIAFLFTFHFNQKQLQGQSLIYSPANEAVIYEPLFRDGALSGDPEYFGIPNQQIDDKWEELLIPASIHLTPEERSHFDPESPIVRFPDGSYFGQLTVYHELHCLKRVYQYINSEYYFPNLTDRDKEMNRMHTEHCLGIIRNGIMCHGDATIMTMVWGKTTAVPLGEDPNPHQCVNFDRLHQWALSRAVTDGLEPGVLVHPKLGPSFPDGHGTIIGFNDKVIDKNGQFIKDD